MRLNCIDHNHVAVVGVRGELVQEECERLRKKVLERVEGRVHDVVLDFHELDQIDSKGLETLVWVQDHCADHIGQLRLAGCPDFVEKVLEMTRLSSRFTRLETVADALDSLR